MILLLAFFSSDTNVHVLYDQVRRAIVDETTAHVLIREKWAKLLRKLLLSVVIEDHVLVLLNNCKALVEDLATILLAHESLEFGELARANVDHLFLAHVACDISILSNIVDGGGLCALGLTCTNIGVHICCLSQALDILLIPIVADVRYISRHSCWRLWVRHFGISLVTCSQMRLILLIFIVEEGRVVVLLHILLRRLVHIHVCHLLLSLLSLHLRCLSFLFFFSFLLGLNALKFIKHILVVQ